MRCLKGMSFCACFRLEMQELRERQKEEEVLALKRSMEGGMVSVLFQSFATHLLTCKNLMWLTLNKWQAQAMKEQARLKEEMVYLYKIGDMEVWYKNPDFFCVFGSSSVSLFKFIVDVTFSKYTAGCSSYTEKVGSRCSYVMWSFWLNYIIFSYRL